MTTEKKIEVVEKNLERLLGWISRFDTKSSIVLGADTGMLGILATFAPAFGHWTFAKVVFASLAFLCLIGSLFFIYAGTYPRIKETGDSLFYFGAIARHSPEEYRRRFMGQSSEEYLKDLLDQCHINSVILDEKFADLRRAYRLLFLGLIPWGLAIYTFKTM
jgi:hypothetical protein